MSTDEFVNLLEDLLNELRNLNEHLAAINSPKETSVEA